MKNPREAFAVHGGREIDTAGDAEKPPVIAAEGRKDLVTNGELLNDAASRKRGLGPDCKNRAAVDEVRGIKEAERKRMRAWLRTSGPNAFV